MSTPRLPPVWLVLVGILSVQFGAAISKGLFDEIPPVGMVFLRLVTSSVILILLARPRLGGPDGAWAYSHQPVRAYPASMCSGATPCWRSQSWASRTVC